MTVRAACTIAAKEQWALARVVAVSFAEHHPDVPVSVLLADEPDGAFEPAAEPFEVVRLGDLALPHRPSLLFRYAQQPLSYALTPYLLSLLLERGCEQRLDLRRAFPDHLGADRQRFVAWTVADGAGQLGVEERLAGCAA